MPISKGTLTTITFPTAANSINVVQGGSGASEEWTWSDDALYAVVDVYIAKDGAWTPAAGDLITVGLYKTVGTVDQTAGDDWPDTTNAWSMKNIEQWDMYDGDPQVIRIVVPDPIGKAKLGIFSDTGTAGDDVDVWARYQEVKVDV